MFTAKALGKHIQDFLITLDANSFAVEKAVLFGSYATGKAHKLSDIDLAVWLEKDLEKHYSELPWLLKIVSYFHPIKPKFYNKNETSETDPFIKIIEAEGKSILLPAKKNIKPDHTGSGVTINKLNDEKDLAEIEPGETYKSANRPYILISGSYDANSKNDLLCSILGSTLAEFDLGIISGANTPGRIVSKSFGDSLKLYDPDKIIFYRRKKTEDNFKVEVDRLGSIKFYGESHSELRKEMINKVKAVIVIGGNTGTLDEESLASQNKIPVIPIAITEGAAYKIWEAYKDTKNSQVFNEWQFDKNLFEQLNDTSLPTASEAAISLLKHSIQLT